MVKWDQIGIKKGETGVFDAEIEPKAHPHSLRLIMSLPQLHMPYGQGLRHPINSQSITFAMPTPTGGGTPPSVLYYMIPKHILFFKKPSLKKAPSPASLAHYKRKKT